MEWKNVTKHFTEEERQYNGKYLEIDEVYDDVVEVSLFSAKNDIYEIYISFGIMCGISHNLYVHFFFTLVSFNVFTLFFNFISSCFSDFVISIFKLSFNF